MKNPMDRQLEKRLSDRAVAIGREGNVAAFGELLELLQVEINKSIEARDGTVVQSEGERRIAD